MFNFDPNYEQTEAEWDEIKKEILGEVEEERMKQGPGIVRPEGEEESEEEEEEDKNVRLFYVSLLIFSKSWISQRKILLT